MKLLLPILLTVLSSKAYAEKFTCYDEFNSIVIEPPKDWIPDYRSAKQNGVCNFFYPTGFDINSAPIVVYANFNHENLKMQGNRIDLEDYIKDDIAPFLNSEPKPSIESPPNFLSRSGRNYRLKKITNGRAPNGFEIVAYLPLQKSIFMVVFSARTKQDFKKYEPVFMNILDYAKVVDRKFLFADAQRIALSNSKMDSGIDFDKRLFRSEFGAALASALKTCSKKGDRGINAVLEFAEDGNINEWTNESSDAASASACVKVKIGNAAGPRPPFAPYHYLLEVKIKP